ncbi:unnamed protein product [Penicillium camemberti]|uniref:Str. FM013 n=1 Tax=Penicillium camemberti (strain FM 013) TaxID=1429867 RepID=A0A0G4P8B5_PENC3|nr:unnamed protein product [Penicillium camemberti]
MSLNESSKSQSLNYAVIRTGALIWAPAGTTHWHGANDGSIMTHTWLLGWARQRSPIPLPTSSTLSRRIKVLRIEDALVVLHF